MRHFDYRMSKAVGEERLAQASRPGRPAREEGRHHQLLRLKRYLGRGFIAFGRRLVHDEVDVVYRGREGVEPAPPN